jgi:hypothetical protein
MLRLVPPPVVLVHGVGEAPESIWATVLARLRDEARLSVFLVDYGEVEGGLGQHPRTLWGGAGAGLQAALSAMREAGVAVSRADVVTHGAGAAVARAWIAGRRYRRVANFGHGDVRRLITVAAPHLGSDLARAMSALHGLNVGGRPFAEELRAGSAPLLVPRLSGAQSALALDVAPRSQALVDLGETSVSAHAIAGVARDVDVLDADGVALRALLLVARGMAADTSRLRPLLDQVEQAGRFEGLAARLAAFAGSGDAWLEGAADSEPAQSLVAELRAALFGGTQNDGVVRVESQWGGLEPPCASTFPGLAHGRAPHDPAVVERIHALLSGPADAFASGFPSPDAPVRNLAPR